MFREHELRIERLVKQVVAPIRDDLTEIKVLQKETNGRVTGLERREIIRDAKAEAIEGEHARAAQLVAQKAADAIASRERSRRWWFGVVGAAGAGVGIIATGAGMLAQVLT